MQQANMENVLTEHQNSLAFLNPRFRRLIIDDIDWNDRLTFILGPRGVGKTTLILQHIKEKFGTDPRALYISMDDLVVSQYKLIDIAKYHFNSGGTHLFIDEIHKYENWSIELKNIYDKLKPYSVVASGSSILEVQQGNADLSRRSITVNIPGLSFREYINIENNSNYQRCSLWDIMDYHVDIAHDIVKEIKPTMLLSDYVKYGYYPFYLEGKQNYHKKLGNVLNLILESDIPYLMNTDISKVAKVRKLIYILSTQVPYQPNISKLAGSLELNRATLTSYLHYLEKASILNLLWDAGKSYSALSKPGKIYLQNCNLSFLSQRNVNIGTLRETFFLNQINVDHQVNLSKKGDFLVEDKFTFEIGGMNKDFSQLEGVPNSYVVADDLLIGSGNKIPLWLFGFLY
ncbi:ATP-binding protein [Portibacter lacus]|nr:AAA family ATPase [Portibacter lacus]